LKQNQFYLAIIKLPYFYKIKYAVKINSYYSHAVTANTILVYHADIVECIEPYMNASLTIRFWEFISVWIILFKISSRWNWMCWAFYEWEFDDSVEKLSRSELFCLHAICSI